MVLQSKARINARLRLCEIAGKPVGDLHPVCNGIGELRFAFGPGIVCILHKKAQS